jgi:hypothetical protein
MTRPILLMPPILLSLAVLAACGAEPQATNNSQTNTVAAADDVDYLARIRSMPQGQRNAVFLRAIRDANQPCQGVTELTEVTGTGGPATWAARCDDGGRWVVSIAPNGTATVSSQAAVQGAAKG